jgi:hypothetical protein
MSSIIQKISNLGRKLGLFSVMVSMAFAIAGTPAASAAPASGSTLNPSPSNAGELVLFVVDTANSKLISGAAITVFDATGSVVAKGLTPATGILSFRLPEGAYKVAGTAQGFDSGRASVSVFAGQDSRLKLGLNPTTRSPLAAGR